MAKKAPVKAAVAPKVNPETGEPKLSTPKPAKSATSSYKMNRSGVAEGVSGEVYKYSAGQVLETPAGDLDHLGARYCVKK